MMKVAVIGGGAAGFFAAISCKQHNPDAKVFIFEKSSKLLSKVKVSGGGRCNVTNSCTNTAELIKCYPRGEKFLKKSFQHFSTKDTVKWFEARGVQLKTELDNRMFPATDNSQTIIDCLLSEVNKLGVSIKLRSNITSLVQSKDCFDLKLNKDEAFKADRVIIASGGSPKLENYLWLKDLGHMIESPIPSLFTFNMPSESIKSLMGLTVKEVSATIQGTKYQQSGPLLITHWGMSGPAILKLSAFAARHLNDQSYNFKVRINWIYQLNEEMVKSDLAADMADIKKRKILNTNPFRLPNRLWEFLINKTNVDPNKTWNELGKKEVNKLINTILNDSYEVKGKTTFKEEFVTCGGINLSQVSPNTMESKICSGLYFAGEILDIDAITGGFNFQAAWTTGFIAGKLTSG